MAAKHKVEWSKRAVADLDQLYNNLLEYWTPKEANLFLDMTQEFEQLVATHPEVFSASRKYKSVRLGLIHKNVTAVYTVKKT